MCRSLLLRLQASNFIKKRRFQVFSYEDLRHFSEELIWRTSATGCICIKQVSYPSNQMKTVRVGNGPHLMSNAKFQNVSLKEKLDCALLQENTQKKIRQNFKLVKYQYLIKDLKISRIKKVIARDKYFERMTVAETQKKPNSSKQRTRKW